MKFLVTVLLLSTLAMPGITVACGKGDGSAGTVADLSVVATSFAILGEGSEQSILTLGAIKNASQACMESLVVEVKYFDASKTHIDTVTQLLYGVVVPPHGDVAFRTRETAARPKDQYATQSIRIVSAEARADRTGHQTSTQRSFQDEALGFLWSWGPMLLLIGVWIYFMQRMKRKDSPQERTLTLIEQQNTLFAAQVKVLERIADSREQHKGGGGDA